MRISGLELGDVGAWPRWLKAVVFAMTALWVLGVGDWLVLGEQRRELAAMVQRGVELRRATEQKLRQVDQVAALRQHDEQLSAALSAALGGLPATVDLPALIEDLSQAATDSGLAIHSIHVSDEQVHGFYAAMPIAVAVSGTYHQFGAFIAAAAALARPVTFHDFDIGARGDGLMLNLAARTYRATEMATADAHGAPSLDASTNAVAYAGTGRSPFEAEHEPSTTGRGEMGDKQPLETFALPRLRMVGAVGRRGVAFALIGDPTGYVHRVGVGDRLGMDGGQVTTVGLGGMEVVETVSDGAGGWTRRVRRLIPTPATRFVADDVDAADRAKRKPQGKHDQEQEIDG